MRRPGRRGFVDVADTNAAWLNSQRKSFLKILLTAIFALAVACGLKAQCDDLFFSEYIEGTSNNKALEIFNPTDQPIDLASGEYVININSNGSQSITSSISLTGVIPSNGVFVVAHSSADPSILSKADQVSGGLTFNGDDAVWLQKQSTFDTLDVIGQIGLDPGSEWGTDPTSTANNTIVRKSSVFSGDNNGLDVFDPAIEWDGFPVDDFSHLGTHTIDSCLTVSANVDKNYETVNIFPNPATNNIHVLLTQPSKTAFINVFDIYGHKVLSKSFKNKRNINVPMNQKSGVYFVELIIGGKKIIKKVILK